MDQILNKTKGDKVIWAVVMLLTLMSLLVVYSSTGTLAYKLSKSTESYLFKQFAFIAIGVMIIYFAHRINYTIYSRVALILLFMYLSRQLSRAQDEIKDFRKGFLPLIIPVGIICVLIAPANLSTALLIGSTSLLLMFIGRASMKHILLTILVAIVPVIMLVTISLSYYDQKEHRCKDLPAILSVGRMPTWIKRVQDFVYADKEETAYQVQQAKIAIAKGGWLGLGPGNSEQRNFLPHPYSDFIFAIIIEEYGLIGGTVILLVYLLFLFRSIRIFKKCPYAFGAFLAVALSFTLVIQALVNMAVNVNLFPVTGVTLPLMSMGGSSFLFTCLAIGIILSVARNVEKSESAVETVNA